MQAHFFDKSASNTMHNSTLCIPKGSSLFTRSLKNKGSNCHDGCICRQESENVTDCLCQLQTGFKAYGTSEHNLITLKVALSDFQKDLKPSHWVFQWLANTHRSLFVSTLDDPYEKFACFVCSVCWVPVAPQDISCWLVD